MMQPISNLILAAILVASPLSAHGPEEQPEGPTHVVRAFHEALRSGDAERALSFLAPEVMIFESGGAELSRAEYGSHHLESDMEFVSATKREIVDRRSGGSADLAWVLTRSVSTGTFREREVRIAGVETMILEWGDDGWQIVHIHWSSRKLAPGDS